MVQWWILNELPPRLALSDSPESVGGGGLNFLWKEACYSHSRGGGCSSFPVCSLQLIDAGSLLPFSLPVQCKAQLCHWELHQSPVCRCELRGAQQRRATFTPSLFPSKPHRADREKELSGQMHWGPWRRPLTWSPKDRRFESLTAAVAGVLSSFKLIAAAVFRMYIVNTQQQQHPDYFYSYFNH